jgi:S-adenosylmethionine hydrolase
MNTISLLTDFGSKDNFVGIMKAVILSINPRAQIVDISHHLKAHDILGGALLLKSSFRYFPSGTVHVIVVDPGVGTKRKKLLIKTKNYFFIGPDNGCLALALKEERIEKIIEITNRRYFLKPVSSTFHGRDIFAPVAAHISKGEKADCLGRRIKSFKKLDLPKVKRSTASLTGEIIYIDRFGNLTTNIDGEVLKDFIKNRRFKICVQDKQMNSLSHSYAQDSQTKWPLALINSFGYLEIAVGGASAQSCLGVNKGTEVLVVRT